MEDEDTAAGNDQDSLSTTVFVKRQVVSKPCKEEPSTKASK